MLYLEDVDFTSGTIDIELAIGWIIRIDTLARQEVDDVLGTILVAIGGRHLYTHTHVGYDQSLKNRDMVFFSRFVLAKNGCVFFMLHSHATCRHSKNKVYSKLFVLRRRFQKVDK